MMMKTIMKPAFLMVEIAVDLMSIPIGAQIAYALKQEVEAATELQQLLELQIAETAIRAGLEMDITMISTIMQTATMMEEIAVYLMSIQQIKPGLEMGLVMM